VFFKFIKKKLIPFQKPMMELKKYTLLKSVLVTPKAT